MANGDLFIEVDGDQKIVRIGDVGLSQPILNNGQNESFSGVVDFGRISDGFLNSSVQDDVNRLKCENGVLKEDVKTLKEKVERLEEIVKSWFGLPE
jgi:archaellum component FlaC